MATLTPNLSPQGLSHSHISTQCRLSLLIYGEGGTPQA